MNSFFKLVKEYLIYRAILELTVFGTFGDVFLNGCSKKNLSTV
jgi:hypothetical protein